MKSDRLLRWLNIGANLAVLGGLIFVGVQVRDGRAAAEAQVADGIADGFLQLNIVGISDPEVACLWIVGLASPDSLDVVDAARFSLYIRGVFNQFERVQRQFDTGLADDDTWSIVANEAAWLLTTPGGRAHFAGNPLSADFLQALEPFRASPTESNMTLGRTPPPDCQ